MYRLIPRALAFLLITAVLSLAAPQAAGSVQANPGIEQPVAQSNRTYGFRYPVVPGATISGYFDHNPNSGMVAFFDGRYNNPGSGFYFQCSSPWMYDWVGCTDSVSGEPECQNSHELWYDGHKGTDYEYSADWHTGAYCDPDSFSGITSPVYASARGRVVFAGYNNNRPGNGWHILINHDLNNNGNFNDDNIRAFYLHFSYNALAVVTGQVVEEGQYLGQGGSTGYSSSPHLHFEVQRSNDYFQTTSWSVDPFGWSGANNDPWPFQNTKLFREPYGAYVPDVRNRKGCTGCGELLRNNGFEDGPTAWVEQGTDIIINTSFTGLSITPQSGDWLAWLGGRNDAADGIYQEFTAPSGPHTLRLRYFLYIAAEETSTPQDYLYVRLRLPDGTVAQDIEMVSNTFPNQGQWVQRELSLPSLNAWEGQTIRIQFKATTNAENITNFYLDEISLLATEPQ